MRLPGHEGACASSHGYDFRLTVKTCTTGEGGPGFALDLLEIDHLVQTNVLSQLADRSLNDTLQDPSLENTARWIGCRLAQCIPGFTALMLEAGERYAVEMNVEELSS